MAMPARLIFYEFLQLVINIRRRRRYCPIFYGTSFHMEGSAGDSGGEIAYAPNPVKNAAVENIHYW